jgi:hypothetical protein
MKVRLTLGALLAAMAALLVAFATPALAKGGGTGGGGTGGGGGGGGITTVPAVSCAQIVSAIVDPNPLPINPNPVFPEPIVMQMGAPVGPAVAFDVTVNNQCADEVAAGPKGSLAVATTVFDTATGARLFTGVNMQPAFARMTWRSWLSIPTADTTVPNYTDVISLTKANGQVQDTLTYTAAALDQAILTAEATGLPQSLR